MTHVAEPPEVEVTVPPVVVVVAPGGLGLVVSALPGDVPAPPGDPPALNWPPSVVVVLPLLPLGEVVPAVPVACPPLAAENCLQQCNLKHVSAPEPSGREAK